MTIEYYVKHKPTGKKLLTCETSEQAMSQMKKLERPDLAVFYSPDAIAQYVEDGKRRFNHG